MVGHAAVRVVGHAAGRVVGLVVRHVYGHVFVMLCRDVMKHDAGIYT